MRCLAVVIYLLLAMWVSIGSALENPKTDLKTDAKRCVPQVVHRAHQPRQMQIQPQKREKPTGFAPIIAFQIQESGEVVQSFVKRSSGIAAIDTYALTSIRGTKYNSRTGCGIIEAEARVDIDMAPEWL